MYFLGTLIFFSSTFVLAHDRPHDSSTSSARNPDPDNATPSSARLTNTVFVTITHALHSPSPYATISKPNSMSGSAVPPSTPLAADAEKARPAYMCTRPGTCIINNGPVWSPNTTGSLPTTTFPKTAMNSTAVQMFTLHTPSKSMSSVPLVKNHTPTPAILETINPSLPSVTVSSFALKASSSGYASPPPPSADEDKDKTFSVLPVGGETTVSEISGFKWPSTTTTSNTPTLLLPTHVTSDDNVGDEDGDEYNHGNGHEHVVWAGVDNAILSQPHGRSLPHFSPPQLRPRSAGLRKVQAWKWLRNGTGRGKEEDKVEGRSMEKRMCRACEEEGRVLCRGDVAVGVCRGGCVELQMLGRGKGNGCEDD